MASLNPPRGPRSIHSPAPESLEAILKRTTYTPVLCHPKLWSDVHLEIFRVEGLDRTFPLEDVIGRPIACDPSDAPLQTALEGVSRPYSREPFGLGCKLLLEGLNRTDLSDRYRDRYMKGMCWEMLRNLREDIRKYPCYELCPTPDFFPITSLLCMTHDVYAPEDVWNHIQEEKRLKRWAKRSKSAEIVALLLATAQQQLKRMARPLQSEYVQPILITANGNKVQFFRARFSVQSVDALTDPSQLLDRPAIIKQSPPLDFYKESDRIQLVLALAAVLDEYFQDIRPTLSPYQVPDHEQPKPKPRKHRRSKKSR
ncbi:predicted protein [Uncinocarpus reesii 1704]|uniref:Uncharacterized protein n=1 Tax=Uncinocarpus reesii (strain UAMH 1704) TaxID=336963 RepID=C4JYK8_UNCRE|nr:uncharacterized protein UREG_07259 [Uncinocarpus reesii 1704]EEP82394.1 predicted protein [Uncinocarpus reesii 1704]